MCSDVHTYQQKRKNKACLFILPLNVSRLYSITLHQVPRPVFPSFHPVIIWDHLLLPSWLVYPCSYHLQLHIYLERRGPFVLPCPVIRVSGELWQPMTSPDACYGQKKITKWAVGKGSCRFQLWEHDRLQKQQPHPGGSVSSTTVWGSVATMNSLYMSCLLRFSG